MSWGFASGIGFADDWREAADACLARAGEVDDANLGFLYISDHFAGNARAILTRVQEATGIEHWVGSVGLGICGDGQAALDRPGIALMIGHFAPHSFHVFSGRQPLRASDEAYFAVVHGDANTPDMSELVIDMSSKVSSGFVTGGLSSSRGRSLQIADGVISGGISGVAFSPDVQVSTRLTQGCVPLPGRHTITKSDDNVIATLDGRPALEVYLDAAGASADDVQRVAHEYLVGLLVPGRESHDYAVRHVIGIGPESGVLAINEQVSAGQSLLICRRDKRAALTDMKDMLDALKASLYAPPRAALYFSCLARGHNSFDSDSTEVELIRAAFGDIPLAGFFCNGEISHDRLYAYTGVLTLFA